MNHFSDLARVLAGLGSLILAQAQAPDLGRFQARPPDKPNIIFILADDLGYGDLGCYGQNKIRTPNIDRLAEEGMRFTQCYAGSTVCAPSRCCLMTGRHTGHARIRGNARVPLAPEDLTVAEFLKTASYKTAAIGKWGLGDEGTTGIPNRHGFDEWFGYLDQVRAHDYYPEFLWRNERQFQLRGNANGRKGDYSHDWFTRSATNFIRISQKHPFFLYLAYTIPHANNELKDKGMEVPADVPYSREQWPQQEKNKAAMITRLDADVGKILGRLKELKLDQNTIIFFSSDNGPHQEGGVDPKFFGSSGPLRGIKRDLYEGGIRVPMIVRWPGRIKTGSTNAQVWAFWDFLPTAAEIAGVKPPKDIDGISMLPTLLGTRQTNQHEFLYWEFHERGFQQAARMRDWKAVRPATDTTPELYDLTTDLGETKNVANQHPEIVARIEEYLKSARTESADWPIKSSGATKPIDR
ncbi:MAG: arylsulfatase [Verrucomicrobia bacterium]|nr:MAG: arylsulfatase [Verrucomicrobiota bacterium]